MSSSPIPTIALGGSASHIQVGRIAFGCMGMSWTDPASMTPDEQAFEAIRAAVDAGSNFLNTGAFYGPPSDPYANIKLLRRFYNAHPEYKDKTVLSVKGGMDVEAYKNSGVGGLKPNASVEALEADLRAIRQHLGSDEGGKSIDVFEMARRDTKYPVTQIMHNMLSLSSQTYTDADGKQAKGKGLFDHISLSELGLASIKEAVQAAPVACVELEISPWELEAYSSGIVEFCEANHLPILAYSPVGKGLLTGTIKSADDIPAGDVRHHMDRLNKDNLNKNLELAHEFIALADKQQPPVTPAQLGLAWLLASSKVIVPLPGTTKAARAKENAAAAGVKLDDQTKTTLDDKVRQFKVAGGRYNEAARTNSALWG